MLIDQRWLCLMEVKEGYGTVTVSRLPVQQNATLIESRNKFLFGLRIRLRRLLLRARGRAALRNCVRTAR
jgi:hypothetical protein